MVMPCLGHSFSPSVPQRTPPGQEELLNGRLVYRTAWSCTVQRKMAPTKLLLGKSSSLRIESLLASEFIFYCLLFLLVKFPSFSGCSHYSNVFELFPLCTQELFFFLQMHFLPSGSLFQFASLLLFPGKENRR